MWLTTYRSSMKKHPRPFLHHIVDFVEEIETHLSGKTIKDYQENRLLQLATIKLLENMGEACKNLSQDFQNKYPEIPWKEIIGMRNKTTHEYWDIKDDIVWEAATIHAPKLKNRIKESLKKVDNPIQ